MSMRRPDVPAGQTGGAGRMAQPARLAAAGP